jgi:uncharacterized damage-inducible protein DinB
MDERTLFLKYWDKEAEITRKVLSRIPEGSTYRPDPKARTATDIAWLIVRESISLADLLAAGVIEWVDTPTPATIKEIVDTFDRDVAAATKKLHDVPASQWDARVAFTYQGKEVTSNRGGAMAWGFLFDVIHHRGQLTTYLRPMGSTVPSIYGPSADEPM